MQNTIQAAKWERLDKWTTATQKTGIYLIRRVDGKSIYVGSSTNTRKRLGEHANSLRRSRHTNSKLTKCFDFYGLSGMEFAIVEECEQGRLVETETAWIAGLNSYQRGLNCTPSATGAGKKAGLETKLKIGAKSRGRIPSEETRRLISIASKNQSPESRAAAALKKRGRPRSELAVLKTAMWHKGKKRSSETSFNISKSLSKIDEVAAKEIFGMISQGLTYREISERFGVSRQTVCNLRKSKTICLRDSTGPPPELVSKHTEATRERRSRAQRGRVASEESKRKMSEARLGVAKSEEHRAAIGAAIRRYHEQKRLGAGE